EAGPGEPEAVRFIGPTLAQDSLSRGLAAAGVGLGLVILFLLLYYRGAGFVAVFTLICSLIYLLTVISIFNATLTLPGLAGLVLTVGLAVDANILILERIREEMAKGKTALQAFESGHDKAFSAILDANITSLIAAGVLYYFGTGPVKGFAIILSIGILTTMFSVLVLGKVLIKLLIQSGTLRNFTMMKIWSKTNVNFVRIMPACIILSILAVIGGALTFSQRLEPSEDGKTPPLLGMDFRGGTRLSFRLYEKSTIKDVRQKIKEIVDENNEPIFPDAEVTAMAEEEGSSATKFKLFATTDSHTFQVRSSTQDQEILQSKIQNKFKDQMPHVPFASVPETEIPSEEDFTFQVTVSDGPSEEEPAGAGTYVYLLKEGFSLEKAEELFRERARHLGFSRDNLGKTNIKIDQMDEAPENLVKLRVLFAASDMEQTEEESEPENLAHWRDTIVSKAAAGEINLSKSPFESAGKIGPSIASDLRDSTIWALIFGWVLMIIYIAIRFTSWKFGLAAVFALVHDGIVAMGVVALCGAVIPATWGLSFEMNVVTVAALLTIVGYSVNDTIVLFDRIRENLTLLKRESFRDIINLSVNQTMSRTLLTSFSTLLVVVVLYIFTMNSAGGVSEFAFPLIIGVLVGTYSSIYVASSSVMWLFRGKKPQTSK
ncbi:MAG: protein translocase subunit SecF, partial [Planctomycetota bacterium]|nr:protein translocase subunit SecF [Planctomycetota bacterium]